MVPAAQNDVAARHAKRADAVQLTVIGLAAGAFSALFGVGGGIVLVPLLILWRGLDEKTASGTSLLAIAIVAAYAFASYAAFGHGDVAKGVLIGIPAMAGVVFGTWLQQRLDPRILSGMFSVLVFMVFVLYMVR